MPKVDFCMIVFNGDYVLRENLEAIYPFANRIVITEGPVAHYQRMGFTGSTDGTLATIQSFPDPERKIVLIRGQWPEKDEMVKAQNAHYAGDFVWHVDCDEIYCPEDMAKVFAYLDSHPECYSMGFRLRSFFGGFDRYISGFEENWDTLRIQRIIPGQSGWYTHRPPTMLWPPTGKTCKDMGHVDFRTTDSWGIRIYHYCSVFPSQVKAKSEYYRSWCGQNVIDLWGLYVKWMRAATDAEKEAVEQPTMGVQEWVPSRRGPAFTRPYAGGHPEAIKRAMMALKTRIDKECVDLGIRPA
jgi:hypothetical protein